METLDLLTLALLPGVGPKTLRDLASRGPLPQILATPEAHAALLEDTALGDLTSGRARARAEKEMAKAEPMGVRLVRWDEPQYPELLRRIYDPPAILYVRGEV